MKYLINKSEFRKYLNNLKEPENQGKFLGNTLGTTIASGTIGALTGELLNDPLTGVAIGASFGAGLGALQSRKYFKEVKPNV